MTSSPRRSPRSSGTIRSRLSGGFRPATIALLLLVVGLGFFPAMSLPVEAQSIFRRRGDLNALQRSQWRALYKPDVRILRPPGSGTTFRAGQRLTYAFSARRGWVSHIEIRSGLRVLRRIDVGRVRSGRGVFTLTEADFARVGKTGKRLRFQLRVWQGKPGYQSVSGVSAPYRLQP